MLVGPLQFMVVAFDYSHFQTTIIPELRNLTHREVVRVVDILIVNRDEGGRVSSQEFAEAMPDESIDFLDGHIESASEWFTQEDVEAAGHCMALGTAVALILLDHRWAEHLDDAVHEINQSLLNGGNVSRDISLEIERHLVMGSNAILA
jgi:hypothetical protein